VAHREFLDRLESLVNGLDAAPVSTGETLREVSLPGAEFNAVKASLSPAQNNLLSLVLRRVSLSDKDDKQIPSFFTASDFLHDEYSDVAQPTLSTLQLFEKLGIIIPITVHIGDTDIRGYRLAAKEDMWDDLSAQESES
jgi:hypothetical protein